ncbi:MAG: GDSL-type esterase/lipase family protein [Ruminococcus sp.]|nr:GDSL-type esterase/lipase family protein [Ruminococcus sp.]
MAEIVPNPLISRGVPAYSETNPSTASAANDEHYYSFWSGTAPDKLAYDLSEIPEKQRKTVIAVWYTTSTFDKVGSYASQNMIPTDYTVEVNAADGGKCPESGWEIVETVENNSLASREHVVDMAGYNWIRLNIAKSDGKTGGQVSLNLDIHTVSDGIADSWLFLGDSITACGMNNCYGTGFATHLHNLDDRYFPIQENGGIGGITSSDGKNNIDRWLETFPGKFVSIAYGTNDAWGDQTGAETYYYNTKYMIDAVLKSGKVPVLPKIPFSIEKGVADNLAKYNAMIDRLWTEYGDKLVKGADLEAFLGEHTEYLSGDGVHPSDVGYEAIRKFWAETMYNNVYTNSKFSTSTDDAVETLKYGDANCDGEINMGDVVLIMQNIADSGKYGLHGSDKSHITENGLKNADVSGNNDGVTLNDALAIQKYKLDLIKSLPEE